MMSMTARSASSMSPILVAPAVIKSPTSVTGNPIPNARRPPRTVAARAQALRRIRSEQNRRTDTCISAATPASTPVSIWPGGRATSSRTALRSGWPVSSARHRSMPGTNPPTVEPSSTAGVSNMSTGRANSTRTTCTSVSTAWPIMRPFNSTP